MNLWLRTLLTPLAGRAASSASVASQLVPPDQPLPYSWVLTNTLAVGPLPSSEAHWQQLDAVGLRSRFSCCYPVEQAGLPPPPPHWSSGGSPLPDHREQEPLQAQQLALALEAAEQMMERSAPLYLHCLAGMQRSPLLAVGLAARQRNMPLLMALDWVRRCHPAATPLYSHLEVLEQVLAR